MRIKFVFVFLTLVYCCGSQSLEEGILKYKENNFSSAIEIWMACLKKNPKDDAVLYNIGNAYYQLKNYPEAIYYFQQVLRYNPSHEDAIHNLKLSRSAAGLDDFEFKGWNSYSLLKIFKGGIDPFYTMLIYSMLTSVGLWILVRKKWKILAAFCITLGILFLSSTIIQKFISKHSSEYILMQICPLKRSPDDMSESIQELKAGEQIRIIDQIEDWSKIQNSTFDEGWINCTVRKIMD
ncbi:MAG: tetratricopeptide repeat protein [Saprospiraceae bacterium]|nr:tetratricopeptide repeat protein [Saprospiraceae bacterium]